MMSMFFLCYWRRDVVQRARKKTASLQDNFITAETYQDVLCLCQTLILAVQLFRDKFPHMVFDASRYRIHLLQAASIGTDRIDVTV